MIPNFSSKLFEKLAPEIEASVWVEPVWRVMGKITFKSGKTRYWKGNSFDLNMMGSVAIAKDKAYTSQLMLLAGFPAPSGKAFPSPKWASAIGVPYDEAAIYEYAHSVPYPLIAKPNGQGAGKQVHLVHDEEELGAALDGVFSLDNMVLLEEYRSGRDYRFLVLDDDVVLAYERTPATVTGDGKTILRDLVLAHELSLQEKGREVHYDEDWQRIARYVERKEGEKAGGALSWKPHLGHRVQILPNANLSAGGEARDVTETAHQSYNALAIAVSREFNFRFCGVDLLTPGAIEEPIHKEAVILELNAEMPGTQHFANTSKEAMVKVENVYRRILKILEQ